MAQGLKKSSTRTISRRIRSVEYLGEKPCAGIPIVEPPGGMRSISMRRRSARTSPRTFPGQAVVCAFHGGYSRRRIRHTGASDANRHGSHAPAPEKRSELVRLAIPRRVYTQSHIDYVAKRRPSKHRNEFADRMIYERPCWDSPRGSRNS